MSMSSSLPSGTSLGLNTSTFGPHPPVLHSEATGLHVTDYRRGSLAEPIVFQMSQALGLR